MQLTNLLDRYLEAVRKHLPWQRQDDILAELRVNLESQLEDREAELGRPLRPAEIEEWIRALGPPMQMASHYKPQQYLIGPAVFPTYWYVLRTATFWTLVIYCIANAVGIVASENPSGMAVLQAALRVPVVLMTCAAWVTAVFAALQFAVAHYPGRWPEITEHFADWIPDSLPPLKDMVAPGQKKRSYAQATGEVSFGFLFLGWLLLIPKYPYLWLGPGAAYLQTSFQPAPVWMQFYWWVVVLNAAQLGWRCVVLWRRKWQEPRPLQEIFIKVCGLVAAAILLNAPGHILVSLKDPMLDGARYGDMVNAINEWSHRGLTIGCAILVLQLLCEIGQIGVDAYRKREARMR